MQYIEIDAIKFLACILIVILHGIEPGGGLQQIIYLMGSYGIPLFLVINGWLLADRNVNFKYANKKASKYIKFIGVWILLIGGLLSLVQRKLVFIDILVDIIKGQGILFHLWFLLGVCVIYYLMAFIENINKTFLLNLCKSQFLILYISIIFTAIFVINLVIKMIYGFEIRDYIAPCFRIVTNGGYFLIGISLHNMKYKINKRNLGIICLTSMILLCILSKMFNILWASSMYSSIPVIYGTIAIFLLIMDKPLKIYARLKNIISSSVGVWILHPFILRIINKIYRMSFGDIIPISSKIFITILTIVIAIILTLCIKKNRYLKYLIMEY